MIKKRILMTLWLAIAFSSANAQIKSPVKWSYLAKKINNAEAIVYIKATMDNGWHIYSINQKEGGPKETSITFSNLKDYILVGKVIEPKPTTKYEDVFGINVLYFEKSVVFQQKIKLKTPKAIVQVTVEFMACTDKECLPPDKSTFKIAVK